MWERATLQIKNRHSEGNPSFLPIPTASPQANLVSLLSLHLFM